MVTVSFQRAGLAAALRTLMKSPPWRRDDRTLGLIRINAVGGVATLISTTPDLQLEVSTSCSAEAAAAAFVAPLSTFAPLVDRLPEGCEVRLSAADGGTVVQAGRSRSTLAGLPSNLLPMRPALAATAHRVPAASLAAGLAGALPASINDTARPFLGGVHLREAIDGLSFEAQDGTRIHAVKQDGTRIHAQASIPQRAARIISELLPEDGDAYVAVDERTIQITAGPLRITSALLDGRFPSVEAQLAAPTNRTLCARADTLLADIDLVMTVSSDRDRDFRLDLGAICEASAFRTGGDRGAVTLEAAYTGAPLAIGFQFHLVRDALRLFGASPVEWRMGAEDEPTIIVSADHPGVEAMVSPFRLAAEHLREAA